eukprot:767681-Hanusia_phi.AAC.1
MAPEQLLGEDLTEAVDVWAYATVLWEMMNERKPWEGPLHADMEGLKEVVQNQPADRPSMNQVISVLQSAFEQNDGYPTPFNRIAGPSTTILGNFVDYNLKTFELF